MVSTLTGFQRLRLKSERMRAIGMLLVLVVMSGIGVYHLVYTADKYPDLGETVLAATFLFALFEGAFLVLVERAIRAGRMLPDALWYFEAAVESIFPVIAMAIIMDVADRPFVTLLSPAYPLILIIIAAATLRLSPALTLGTGLLSTLCYALLVFRVLYVDSTLHQNPYEPNLYINMAVMLLVATVVMYFVTRELRRYVDVAVREMELQKELELAHEVQSNLLPFPLPELDGYEITAMSRPALHTGGDYFDCIVESPGQVIFTIADVTGHGIGPALITASSRAYFRAILGHQQQLAGVMQQANCLLSGEMTAGRFVTLAALRLDTANHTAEFLSAGHAPTLLIRGQSGEVVNLAAQAAPMGIGDPLLLEAAVEYRPEPGDVFVMFSDGVYEWRNAAGEQFGLERMTALLQEHRHEPVEGIARRLQRAVEGFSGGQPQQDDVTLLMVKRAAAGGT